MSLSRERFQDLADAHGGDIARWPAAARESAALLMAADPGFAQAVLSDAGRLDEALDAWTLAPATVDLRNAVVASAPALRRPSALARWLWRGALGAGLAAACAAGLVVGVSLSPPAPADEVAAVMTSFDPFVGDV